MGRLELESQPQESWQEPWWVLQLLGPRVEVCVELHPSEVQQQRIEQRSIPPPRHVKALVDTGASMSIVDESIRAALEPAIFATVPLGHRSRVR